MKEAVFTATEIAVIMTTKSMLFHPRAMGRKAMKRKHGKKDPNWTATGA
jgi:hypothetical protein